MNTQDIDVAVSQVIAAMPPERMEEMKHSIQLMVRTFLDVEEVPKAVVPAASPPQIRVSRRHRTVIDVPVEMEVAPMDEDGVVPPPPPPQQDEGLVSWDAPRVYNVGIDPYRPDDPIFLPSGQIVSHPLVTEQPAGTSARPSPEIAERLQHEESMEDWMEETHRILLQEEAQLASANITPLRRPQQTPPPQETSLTLDEELLTALRQAQQITHDGI